MKRQMIFSVCVFMLFLTSCVIPVEEPPIPTTSVGCYVQLPEQSPLKFQDLKAISTFTTSKIYEDGWFNGEIAKTDKPHLIVIKNENNQTVLLGFTPPISESSISPISPNQALDCNFNAESTAKALIMLNLMFVYSSGSQRETIIKQASKLERFQQLKDRISQALIENPDNVLSKDAYPQNYQDALIICQDVLKQFNSADQQTKDLQTKIPPYPYIEDREGPDVAFLNPRFIHYGAGIYLRPSGQQKDIILAKGIEKYIEYELKWPPVIKFNQYQETLYGLGDGQFKVDMYKGFGNLSFDQLIDWKHPAGKATISNIARGFSLALDLALGFIPEADPAKFQPDKKSEELLFSLAKNLAQKDIISALIIFIKLLKVNQDEVDQWLSDYLKIELSDQLLQTYAEIMANLLTTLTSVGMLNEHYPYFYDLMMAPDNVCHNISQTNGILEQENHPPLARINLPVFNSSFLQNQPIEFEAEWYDQEDKTLPENSFAWYSDKEGLIGYGEIMTGSLNQIGQQKITLTVTDSQGLTAEDKTAIEITANNPPLIVILSPLNKSIYKYGQTIYFQGTYFDYDSDIDENSFIWASDKDGEICRQAYCDKDDLSIGEHIISFSVKDIYGSQGQDQVKITIEGTEPPIYELNNQEEHSSYLEQNMSEIYLFKIPETPTLIMMTLDAADPSDLDLYAELNKKPTQDSYFVCSTLDRSVKTNPKMIVMSADSHLQPNIGQYYIMVHAYHSSDYTILCQYLTEEIPASISVVYAPNPATEYKRDWLNNYYYWQVNIAFSETSGNSLNLLNWISYSLTDSQDKYQQSNFSDKFLEWFETDYLEPYDSINKDLRLVQNSKPEGQYQYESIIIAKDQLSRYVSGSGALTVIGQ